MKPSQGKAALNRLIVNQNVEIFTGILLSNVLEAVVADVLDDNRIYVSPNAPLYLFPGGRWCIIYHSGPVG
jgi:hypothetical protein